MDGASSRWRDEGPVGRLAGAARKRGTGAEARKRLVAALALKRLTVREISAALGRLPERERPASWSPSAVGRDLKALREEWAAVRAADVAQLVGEEVARLNALERVWWPKALAGDGGATDRVLAIQRQRARFLGIEPSGRLAATAEAAAGTRVGAEGPVSAVKVRVELVDDWRDA